jgi:hypothetical protein
MVWLGTVLLVFSITAASVVSGAVAAGPMEALLRAEAGERPAPARA